MQITVGIITVSDRATSGEYEDLGGPALKAGGARIWLAGFERGNRARRSKAYSGNNSIVLGPGVRFDSLDRWNRSGGARCNPRSNSRDHARGDSRVRGNDAAGIDAHHPQRDFVAEPGCNRGTVTGDRVAGQTFRRGRMPWLCRRRDPTQCCPGTTGANIVLIGWARLCRATVILRGLRLDGVLS